jgi:PAS domain S-box-containing protein
LKREQQLRADAERSAARMRAEGLAEIAATTRLHQLSTPMLANLELPALLHDVLDAGIDLLGADFGTIQLYDAESDRLRIVAQRGFDQTFLDYFDRVQVATGSGGATIAKRRRVVLEDIDDAPSFTECLHVMRAAECRAALSTPLMTRTGEQLGVLSTHFRRPHRFSKRDLGLLDLYARQAAALIERRQAEEKLRRSEERYRRYFELGSIGGALTSPDNHCLEVNDELCRILGYAREELLGKPWAELTHPDDVAAEVTQFELAMSGNIDSYTLGKRWLRKDGTVVDSMTTTRAVRRDDGLVEYFVGLVQDVGTRNRIQESRQRLEADLAQVARVTTMSEMASSIAHEVNQPLAAIMTNANACARWLALEPSDLQEANQAVARIARDAGRASEVIARIRRFVQRLGLQREPLDLGKLAREALAIVETDLRRHGVATRLATGKELPPVFGDRVQLQQVMMNLLKNAVEAMDPVNDRRRTLEVLVDSYGVDAVCVAVRDSGIGLDRARRENVFDAFHTTKPSGMGMGLAISRSIIDAHGGRLWATPNERHGETFRFTLPLEAAAPDYDCWLEADGRIHSTIGGARDPLGHVARRERETLRLAGEAAELGDPEHGGEKEDPVAVERSRRHPFVCVELDGESDIGGLNV